MLQVSPAAMGSGSGTEEPHDHIQEPVHWHSNAATSPSNGAPSAVAADASSPPPLPPATPLERPQERDREQAGGGSHGTDGPSSAAAGVDRKGKKLAAIPSSAPSPPSSAGSSPDEDDTAASGARTSSSTADRGRPFDCKLVFEQLVQEQAAIDVVGGRWADEVEKKKRPEEEQVKSSHAKEALWSKFKRVFGREGRQIYSEHVNHQTHPITEVRNYYSGPDLATGQGVVPSNVTNHLDAYLEFRPVTGDGECFYRSFIFSYLEQVLDRQDTHEEHRLLDAVKRVSMQHANLGWTSEFSRSYRDAEECWTQLVYTLSQTSWLPLATMTPKDIEH